MKKDLNLPAIIKQHCGIYSGDSCEKGIQINIYKWSGTDRVSILWVDKNSKGHPIIGKCELNYIDHYNSVADLVADQDFFTKTMVEQNWGMLDLRDLQANREFGENFF